MQEEGVEGFVRTIRGELGDRADDVLRQLDLDSYVDDVAQKGDNLADDVVGALCSFSGETLVTTAEGLVAISALETGDYVLAFDEATGTTGFYPILATWLHEDPVMVALVIDGEVVETTPEHPFYTAEGDWIVAGDLQAGDRIRQADGTTGTVEAVAFVYRLQPMYNLTVATAHTFFVGDGQWLVHNTCWKRTTNFRGVKVYQRDDLINPNMIVEWRGEKVTNLDLMRNGFAPYGPDGRKIELHHMLQTQDSAIAEVTSSFHSQHHDTIHIYPRGSGQGSGIDRSAFNSWKRYYWLNRAKDFGG